MCLYELPFSFLKTCKNFGHIEKTFLLDDLYLALIFSFFFLDYKKKIKPKTFFNYKQHLDYYIYYFIV